MKKILFLILLVSLTACKKDARKVSEHQQIAVSKETVPDNSVLSNDIEFINDSILKGRFKLDISSYAVENCTPMITKKKEVYEDYADFEFKDLGDVNGDGKNDSVFVLNPLNWCEENHGKSYYFNNNSIPRIESDSFCCEPKFIFSVGDIDEDDGNELAEYKTSCVSRFKAVRFWTFKKGKWEIIGTFTHMVDNGKYDFFDDFDSLFKKTGKGKFKFLEIADSYVNGDLITEWKTITMN